MQDLKGQPFSEMNQKDMNLIKTIIKEQELVLIEYIGSLVLKWLKTSEIEDIGVFISKCNEVLPDDYFTDFINQSFDDQRKRNSNTLEFNFETIIELKTPKILERHISQLKHEYYRTYLRMCDVGNFNI